MLPGIAFVPAALPRLAPAALTSSCAPLSLQHRAPLGATAPRRSPRMVAVGPEVARALVGVYGMVVAGGGVGAYLKTKSTMSAVSGVASGVVLAAAFAMDNVPLAFGTALALAAVFAVRYFKTKKVMPAGMLLVVSLVFAGLFGATMFT
jgi:uncharacterized membrane protein (UPF0136 family)